MSSSVPFIVSAPGKVILCGEHAVVHAKAGIAAAVSLRSYTLVSKNSTEKVNNSIAEESILNINITDFGIKRSFKISSLPWKEAKEFYGNRNNNNNDKKNNEKICQEIVLKLRKLLETSSVKSFSDDGILVFLYLYVSMLSPETPGYTFTFKSTLPVGAGLGSSASFSVCIATAFALLSGIVSPPKDDEVHVSHSELHKVLIPSENDMSASLKKLSDSQSLNLINEWAYVGELCMHGTPSGIDNTVSSFGGAVYYKKNIDIQKGLPTKKQLNNFPPLRIIITDTGVPRKTSKMVAKVHSLLKDEPEVTSLFLDSIDKISIQMENLLLNPPKIDPSKIDAHEESEENVNMFNYWLKKISCLIRMNHGALVSLDVSHDKIELVRILTEELGIGETKLTGAGGGGCTITLLENNVSDKKIAEYQKKASELGFKTYKTVLGGNGTGVLYPTKETLSEFEVNEFSQLDSEGAILNKVGVNSERNWRFW